MTVSLDFRTLYCSIFIVDFEFMSPNQSRSPYVDCWCGSACCFPEPQAPSSTGWQLFAAFGVARPSAARSLCPPLEPADRCWRVSVPFLAERSPSPPWLLMARPCLWPIFFFAASLSSIQAGLSVRVPLVPRGTETWSRMPLWSWRALLSWSGSPGSMPRASPRRLRTS